MNTSLTRGCTGFGKSIWITEQICKGKFINENIMQLVASKWTLNMRATKVYHRCNWKNSNNSIQLVEATQRNQNISTQLMQIMKATQCNSHI